MCDSSKALLFTRRERAHVRSQDQAAAAGEAADKSEAMSDKSEAKSDKPGTIYGLSPYLCIYCISPYLCIYTMYMYVCV